MNRGEKTAWIDAEKKIVSFHAMDDGRMVTKSEGLFWDYIMKLIQSGYRIL